MRAGCLPVVKGFGNETKKKKKEKKRNSRLPVTMALAVCNYDFSLESKSNQRRVSGLCCAVPCSSAYSCHVFRRVFFSLPVWERVPFSLNGNYEGEQKGHLETKAASAGFNERLQVSRLGVLLQEG